MKREECIKMLLDLGAKDLTEEYHPNKKGKCYLSLEVAKDGCFEFNFDYKQYEELHVYNKKRNINEYIRFNEVKQLLIDKGVIAQPQHFAIVVDQFHAQPIDTSLNWKVGESVIIKDDLPFDSVRWEVVYIQKNKLENITFYYLK